MPTHPAATSPVTRWPPKDLPAPWHGKTVKQKQSGGDTPRTTLRGSQQRGSSRWGTHSGCGAARLRGHLWQRGRQEGLGPQAGPSIGDTQQKKATKNGPNQPQQPPSGDCRLGSEEKGAVQQRPSGPPIGTRRYTAGDTRPQPGRGHPLRRAFGDCQLGVQPEGAIQQGQPTGDTARGDTARGDTDWGDTHPAWSIHQGHTSPSRGVATQYGQRRANRAIHRGTPNGHRGHPPGPSTGDSQQGLTAVCRSRSHPTGAASGHSSWGHTS